MTHNVDALQIHTDALVTNSGHSLLDSPFANPINKGFLG